MTAAVGPVDTISHDIPQMEPLFGEEERALVDAYLRQPGYITEFRKTAEFEAALAHFMDAKHCVAVNNGTISLLCAGLLLELAPGDEVIVPNYTMIASANAFRAIGAAIKFADVERETLCLDLESAKRTLTPRTRAIVFVNANGRYPTYGIEKLRDLAADAGVALIEDAAQGLGSYYPNGLHVGLVGIVGSLSFSAQKIISTGQGGALFTNDDAAADRLRKIKDFGRDGGGLDHHPCFGLNAKFTELQACIGIGQLAKLPARIERKKAITRRYEANLADVPGISLFRHDLQHTTPWFVDSIVERRCALMEHLAANRIRTRVMYPPLNKQPIYAESASHPVSEFIGENGLWLPSHSHLSDDEIDYVCDRIRTFYCRSA